MIKLVCREVGPWSLNAYVLYCSTTRQSVLVDPGAEPDTLQDMLAGTQPKSILITHGHPDHIGALGTIRRRLNVPVMGHPGVGKTDSPIKADRWLQNGDILTVGRHFLRVYHTPGHTEDHICFVVQDGEVIVVGDALFDGGPGKTWSAQGFRQTLKTLRNTVLGWPDSAVCYPGHGVPFNFGERRAAIEKFLQKDHGNFFGDAVWEM